MRGKWISYGGWVLAIRSNGEWQRSRSADNRSAMFIISICFLLLCPIYIAYAAAVFSMLRSESWDTTAIRNSFHNCGLVWLLTTILLVLATDSIYDGLSFVVRAALAQKLNPWISLLITVLGSGVYLFSVRSFYSWWWCWFYDLVESTRRRRRYFVETEVVSALSEIIARTPDLGSYDYSEAGLHHCDSVICSHMAGQYGLNRGNSFEYGFCNEAVIRLSSACGSYTIGEDTFVETNFRYSNRLGEFPVFSPQGRYTLEPQVLGVTKLNDLEETWLEWLLLEPSEYDCDLEEEHIVNPYIFKRFCDYKFESVPDSFAMASKCRGGTQFVGTRAKTYQELVHLELSAYYRFHAVQRIGVFNAGEYKGSLFQLRDINDGEELISLQEYEPKPPDPEEVPHQGVPEVPRLVVEQEKNEDLIVVEPDQHLRECGGKGEVKKSEPVLVESFKGCAAKAGPEFLTHPSTKGFEKVALQSKNNIQEDRERKRYVQKGLIFGGGVFGKSKVETEDTLKIRWDKEVKKPTWGGEEDVRFKIDEFAALFDRDNENSYITKREVKEDIDNILQAKLPKMNKRQRARILRTVNYLWNDARFKWHNRGTKDKQDWALEVTIFCKPDEYYLKPKSRVIVFVPTQAWLRMISTLEMVLKSIKRADNPHWIIPHVIDGQRVDIYWASGKTQKALGEAMQNAIRNYEEEGIWYFFVCGDDNISHWFTADFASYDCSQGLSFFLEEAKYFSAFFRKKDASKINVLTQKMLSFHSGKRSDAFNKIMAEFISLPSGAPWTLMFNTFGTIVFCLTFTRYMVKNGKKLDKESISKCFQEALDACGLDATFDFNPELDGGNISPAGSEFLKGFFIPYKGEMQWIPCEGRICKVGKVIIDNQNQALTPRQLQERISGVANGYSVFQLGPLMSAFVRTWKNEKIKTVAVGNGYTVADEETTAGELEDYFADDDYSIAWLEIFDRRYKIGPEELDDMIDAITENGRSFARFEGGGWERVIQADYLGGIVEEI